MKKLLANLVLVPGAVLLGNGLGAGARSLITGQKTWAWKTDYTANNGVQFRNFPVVTKFYPGLGFALAGKPRWLYAFIGGVLTGGLLDDRLEMALWERWSKRSKPRT